MLSIKEPLMFIAKLNVNVGGWLNKSINSRFSFIMLLLSLTMWSWDVIRFCYYIGLITTTMSMETRSFWKPDTWPRGTSVLLYDTQPGPDRSALRVYTDDWHSPLMWGRMKSDVLENIEELLSCCTITAVSEAVFSERVPDTGGTYWFTTARINLSVDSISRSLSTRVQEGRFLDRLRKKELWRIARHNQSIDCYGATVGSGRPCRVVLLAKNIGQSYRRVWSTPLPESMWLKVVSSTRSSSVPHIYKGDGIAWLVGLTYCPGLVPGERLYKLGLRWTYFNSEFLNWRCDIWICDHNSLGRETLWRRRAKTENMMPGESISIADNIPALPRSVAVILDLNIVLKFFCVMLTVSYYPTTV
ncbi:t22 [Tupaiid betaherpesvirus 1]|uniref:T22 n=1 Tax=Tupaiid herpesvirus 1 (strain 1) TaxID=10397 RepID=Q91TT9_TUHV1|nr:t22 [Tupaiid betaherpesvirus 1]AAK57048.1 t22 [Tupaiid betaherpesvirus 1]